MKFSSVLLAIALVLAGLTGCVIGWKHFVGQIVYEEENDSTVVELPEGTEFLLRCTNEEGTRQRYFWRVDDGGYFDIGTFIFAWGDCIFQDISLPGEYGETDYYECDSIESENCEFHAFFGLETYELGVLQYKFSCHEVESCETWCEQRGSCPGSGCDPCIVECNGDQC